MPRKESITILGSTKKKQSHKRRGMSFWRKIINEFDNRSLPLKDFCAERELAISTFRGWHRRLLPAKAVTQKPQKKKPQNQSQFLPVYVTSPESGPQESNSVLGSSVSSLSEPSGLSLYLNESLKISINKEFHEPTLHRLVHMFPPKESATC